MTEGRRPREGEWDVSIDDSCASPQACLRSGGRNRGCRGVAAGRRGAGGARPRRVVGTGRTTPTTSCSSACGSRGSASIRRRSSAIADANDGNRFSGFSGYDASVDYVVETLEAAGYDPEVQAFDYLAYEVVGPSALQQIAPTPTTYVEGVDFGAITQTDPGDVTAAVTPVDLQLGLGNTSTSGCEAADFAGFPVGNIALLQRGTCTFEIKAENAAAAGAVGIVIFNQGNTAAEDRNNIPAVTLTANNTSGIPVLGTTYALGVTLANTPGLRMRVFANTLRQTLPTYNVHRREDRHERRQRRHGRRAPRLGARGTGHQRQRLGQRRDPRDRDPDGEGQAHQHRALRLVGRRGERARRLDELRQRPEPGGEGSNRALPELRHDRLAELHPDGLRQRRVGLRGSGPRPAGLDRHRGSLRVVLHAQR